MSFSGGYVADMAYTAGFYPETAPCHLAFAALCRGRAPGLAWRPRRVLELGFGQGFGLALLAAANPDVGFEGCDFNAEHVAHARSLADDAGLTNLSLSHTNFENAAEHGENDVDIIILHGVLSWIGPASQHAVVRILDRRLRPGGIAYVSYNCMPGWAPLAPIRRLVLEATRHASGTPQDRLDLALDLIGKLWRHNAGYFVMNPMAAHHVEAMLRMDRAYLAHEYLAESAGLPQFSEVTALLAPAGLSFLASAALLDNFDDYAAPGGMKPLIAQIGDPVLQETVRDFAANRKFRRDIYSRGRNELSPEQRRHALSGMQFILTAPRARLALQFLGPVGDITLKPEFHMAVADALARGTASFDELLALPAFGQNRTDLLVDCLALLIHSGQVLPLVKNDAADRAPAQRFNRVVVERAKAGRFYGHLAAPVARTGAPIDELGLLALAALLEGHAEPAAAARHGLATLIRLGRRPLRENRSIEDEGEALTFLTDRMTTLLAEHVPVWRQLGAV